MVHVRDLGLKFFHGDTIGLLRGFLLSEVLYVTTGSRRFEAESNGVCIAFRTSDRFFMSCVTADLSHGPSEPTPSPLVKVSTRPIPLHVHAGFCGRRRRDWDCHFSLTIGRPNANLTYLPFHNTKKINQIMIDFIIKLASGA